MFFCQGVFVFFSNVEFITVPETSFIDDLEHMRSIQAIFVWKVGFDSACVLEYDLEIDEREEIVYALQLDYITLIKHGDVWDFLSSGHKQLSFVS